MRQHNFKRIIGIVGGMGPLAGVLLQKYIIEATPAASDQDHLPVITYTNPQIPDRTASLLSAKKGDDFAIEIIKTIRVLQSAGAAIIGIPCNTAHLKFESIQAATDLPIINMVESVMREIEHGQGTLNAGLLATDGTIACGVYQKYAAKTDFILPDKAGQQVVMETIYRLKAGQNPDRHKLFGICDSLSRRGAAKIILGCTELSLIRDLLLQEQYPLVDALNILGNRLVRFSLSKTPPPLSVIRKTLPAATSLFYRPLA